MRVQVVEDDANHISLRVCFIDEPLHLVGEVNHGALFSNVDVPEAGLRFSKEEQIARPVPFILIIKARWLPGSCWQRLARLLNELFAGFIKVDLRAFRVVRLGVEFQYVFHASDKFGVDLRDAPLFLQPRRSRLRLRLFF